MKNKILRLGQIIINFAKHIPILIVCLLVIIGLVSWIGIKINTTNPSDISTTYGSMLSITFGGLLTLVGVVITNDHHRKENNKNRQIEYRPFFKFDKISDGRVDRQKIHLFFKPKNLKLFNTSKISVVNRHYKLVNIGYSEINLITIKQLSNNTTLDYYLENTLKPDYSEITTLNLIELNYRTFIPINDELEVNIQMPDIIGGSNLLKVIMHSNIKLEIKINSAVVQDKIYTQILEFELTTELVWHDILSVYESHTNITNETINLQLL